MSRSPAWTTIAASTIALLPALGLLFTVERAAAEPELSLSWSTHGELATCPDPAWAMARLTREIGRAPAAEVAHGVRAIVEIARRSAGYALRLETELAGTRGERVIEGDDCTELSEAAILIIALSLAEADDERAGRANGSPSAPPPAEKTQADAARDGAQPRRLGLALRPELVVEYGLLDSPMLGPGLAFALERAPFRGELSGTWLAYGKAETDGEAIALSLGSARVSGCALFPSAGRVRGGPCLGVELGAARGENRQTGVESHTFWGAATAAARLMVGLWSRLSLVLDADLVASWGRLRYWRVIEDESGGSRKEPLDESKPVQVRGHLGLEIAL